MSGYSVGANNASKPARKFTPLRLVSSSAFQVQMCLLPGTAGAGRRTIPQPC